MSYLNADQCCVASTSTTDMTGKHSLCFDERQFSQQNNTDRTCVAEHFHRNISETNLYQHGRKYYPLKGTDLLVNVREYVLFIPRHRLTIKSNTTNNFQGPYRLSTGMLASKATEKYKKISVCQNKALHAVIGLACIFCVVCLLLLAIIVYQNQLHIKVIRLFFIKRFINYKSLSNIEKEFDVFICYSENESTWVHELLLCRFNDIGVSCCTHEKDFVPGVPILDNIFNFMAKSRRVLFVVTRPFIESRWGQMEMEVARYHAIGKKKESEMLIIMKEHIAVCNMPDVLKNVWFNITCLKYPNPDDEAATERFWEGLDKVFKRQIKDVNSQQQRARMLNEFAMC